MKFVIAGLARLAFLAAGILLVPACTLQSPSVGALGAGPSQSYRVVLLVRCRGCRVFYTAGDDREEVRVEGMWKKTVRVRNVASRFVQLTATPTNAQGYVEHAYIEVDGKIVAEERRNSAAGASEQVTLGVPLEKRR